MEKTINIAGTNRACSDKNNSQLPERIEAEKPVMEKYLAIKKKNKKTG
jgi:hypothetical protein